MAWHGDWLERSDWSRRSLEFGALSQRGDAVAMELARPGGSVVVADRLWALWRELPENPNILRVLDTHWLRYAALDWTHDRVVLDAETAIRCATWGLSS